MSNLIYNQSSIHQSIIDLICALAHIEAQMAYYEGDGDNHIDKLADLWEQGADLHSSLCTELRYANGLDHLASESMKEHS